MVGPRESRDEQRNELVPRELVHDPVPNVDRGSSLGIEPGHEPAELLRADTLGECGRTADIGKEERGFDLGAAGPLFQGVDAAAADPAVNAGGTESEVAQDVAGAPERSVAELAARIRGTRAADPPYRRVPAAVAPLFAGQDAAPFLFHRDL